MLAEKLGRPMRKADLDQAMKEMDPNGDGEIDEEDFTAWWNANKDREGGLAATLQSFKETGALPPLPPRRRFATPLHCAALNNRLSAVKLLVSHGADVEAATADGWRPLHFAADGGDAHVGIAAFLLGEDGGPDEPADPEAAAEDGTTPAKLA